MINTHNVTRAQIIKIVNEYKHFECLKDVAIVGDGITFLAQGDEHDFETFAKKLNDDPRVAVELVMQSYGNVTVACHVRGD